MVRRVIARSVGRVSLDYLHCKSPRMAEVGGSIPNMKNIKSQFANHDWKIVWESREANCVVDAAAKQTLASGLCFDFDYCSIDNFSIFIADLLVKDMSNYRACTIPYRFPSDNPRKPTSTEIAWTDLFLNSLPSFKKRAESDVTVPDAPIKAEKFAQSSQKEVAEIIRRFNIQVNNLTQDRVCEFAKLTPVQLLEETEKAVGDPQLPIQHRALVEKSKELKNMERAVERNGETLNQLKALIAEQERDVASSPSREEFLKKVESMRKKLPWLKYDMKKAENMEAKEQENGLKRSWMKLPKL
ncbi:hypothetical protein FNV43_RR21542 [Rhamnella rubrinervis]|uniref:Uncharacterized protein n=1 Tax=Rhamnella rubrinervis TaxID=2594499 RepID=A0A8K0GVF8_9ROSA|nr:hypothetical protein FNV43_RR21542 [Rhamnella rubrinervis]